MRQSGSRRVPWPVIFALALVACGDTPATNAEPETTGEAADLIGGATVRGKTLELTVGSCKGSPTAKVVESNERVTITARADLSNPDDCADSLTVELEGPLGDRQLVDAFDGETLETRVESE